MSTAGWIDLVPSLLLPFFPFKFPLEQEKKNCPVLLFHPNPILTSTSEKENPNPPFNPTLPLFDKKQTQLLPSVPFQPPKREEWNMEEEERETSHSSSTCPLSTLLPSLFWSIVTSWQLQCHTAQPSPSSLLQSNKVYQGSFVPLYAKPEEEKYVSTFRSLQVCEKYVISNEAKTLI